jgi:hypothetical protein
MAYIRYHSTVLYLVALETPSETSVRLLRAPVLIRNSKSQVSPLHYNVWYIQITLGLSVFRVSNYQVASIARSSCQAAKLARLSWPSSSITEHCGITPDRSAKLMLSQFWGEKIDTLAAIHFTCVKKWIKLKTMHYKKVRYNNSECQVVGWITGVVIVVHT